MIKRQYIILPLLALTVGASPQLVRAESKINPAMERELSISSKDFPQVLLRAVKVIHKNHIKPTQKERLIRWATESMFTCSRLPIPAKISQELDKLDTDKNVDPLVLAKMAQKEIEKQTNLSPDDMFDRALQGIFDQLEPNYRYQSKRQTKVLPLGQLENVYLYGVGLKLRKQSKSGFLEVQTPLMGGPAYNAGMRAGDIIKEIEVIPKAQPNKKIKPIDVSTKGLNVIKGYQLLFGQYDTQVKLRVLPLGSKKTKTVALTRKPTPTEAIAGLKRTQNDRWDYWAAKKQRIAYIRLIEFNSHEKYNSRALAKIVGVLKTKGMKGLILDLRTSQGLLYEAARIAGVFVRGGLFCSVESRGPERLVCELKDQKTFKKLPPDKEVEYVSKSRAKIVTEPSYLNIPIACLVYQDTASLSTESLAACLQDSGRAIIVGERTAGHVEVRTAHLLGDGGRLLLNTAIGVRRNGKNLSRLMAQYNPGLPWGVKPDPGCRVPLSEEERDALKSHFEKQMIIRHPNEKVKNTTFTDRHLETAIARLQQIISKE